MMMRLLPILFAMLMTPLFLASSASAVTVYDPGVAPADANLVFGNHLIAPDAHPSVAGAGGSGFSNAGDVLDGGRTYMYDFNAQADLTDGIANRGDTNFAMMIWDMGAAYDSMRLYTHQDHYSGGPVTTNFVGQDLMEYSVWGSTDGDNFILLSDVLAFDLNGGGVGLPTYTFGGTAPTIVYRGGSAEFGITNAYTREYVFGADYQYYGIRTSQVSLTIPGGGTDADPEIDAIAAFNTTDRCDIDPNDPSCVPVPEPSTGLLLSLSVLGLTTTASRKRTVKRGAQR